jgi:hypothetical protein
MIRTSFVFRVHSLNHSSLPRAKVTYQQIENSKICSKVSYCHAYNEPYPPNKLNPYNIQSSNVIHWRARIPSDIVRRDDAIQLLLHNASDNAIYSSVSKLWILSVDPKLNSSASVHSGAFQERQFKGSSDTALILSRAIERIPVYDPNFDSSSGSTL